MDNGAWELIYRNLLAHNYIIDHVLGFLKYILNLIYRYTKNLIKHWDFNPYLFWKCINFLIISIQNIKSWNLNSHSNKLLMSQIETKGLHLFKKTLIHFHNIVQKLCVFVTKHSSIFHNIQNKGVLVLTICPWSSLTYILKFVNSALKRNYWPYIKHFNIHFFQI